MEPLSPAPEVHLVLSSGGVCCVSYAGAIAALEKNNITVKTISACSAGSIIGALFCAGLTTEQLQEHILKLDFTQLFRRKRFPLLWQFTYPFSKFKHSRIAEIYCGILNANPTFEDMTIPFSTVGIDLITKRFHVYSRKTDPRMLVSEALKIGTSVPAKTPPYDGNGRCVVDAAIATSSPVWLATDYDDNLPIVVMRPVKPVNIKQPSRINEFIERLITAGVDSHDDQLLNQIPGISIIEINCDQIQPMDYHISREQKIKLIDNGRIAAEEAIAKHGKGFNMNTTLSPGNSKTIHNRDDAAENRAERMIRKFNRRLPGMIRNQVFISYSHSDQDWREKFQVALKPFVRNQAFAVWDDHSISIGKEWQQEIDNALDATKVALLLVTQNFLASDYINNIELKYFLEQSKKKHVEIFWVSVEAAAFDQTELKNLQCANNPGKPLAALNEADQYDTINSICHKIKQAFDLSETRIPEL